MNCASQSHGRRYRTRARLFQYAAWTVGLLVMAALVDVAHLAWARDRIAPTSAPPDLDTLQRAFAEIADRVAPSVVGIRVSRRCVLEVTPTTNFEQFVIVNGSGTVVHPDGLILTNEHVVQSAADIEVVFHDGQRLPATVLASDVRSDLAVLEVSRHGLQPATFCEWEDVRRGQWAVAIGNPYGLGDDGHSCVSVGVIANLGRRLPGLGEDDDRLYTNMIQTTAAINPGNSGGPLLNIRGEVIGVVTAVYTRAGVDEGVGFAIPLTASSRAAINTLMAGGQIEHAYLGLALRDVDTGDTAHPQRRPQIVDVEVGGPAYQAGLQVDDIIVAYAGRDVLTADQFADLVGITPIGQQAEIICERAGRRFAAQVTAVRRDRVRVAWMRGEALLWRGARLGQVSDVAGSDDDGVDQRGVVVLEVQPHTSADRAGLHVGDVIQQVDGLPTPGLAVFHTIAGGDQSTVALRVRGRGEILLEP